MLPRFSVKKPYTTLVAIILVIVLGIVSFTGMTTDLLPPMELPYVIVITSYGGASPEEVELTVTRPLESLLGTASGLNDIRSVSQENSSMIMMEFTQGTNMDSAIIELSSSIDMLMDNLPDAVGRPMLMRISPDMLPIMIASVDMQDADLAQLTDLVENEILSQFERIDGVASVDVSGSLEQQYQIRLHDDKIEKLNAKLHADIEEEFDKQEDKLIEAKDELASGRKELENELTDQQENLASASVELSGAIANIQAILAEEALLEAQKAAFEQEKNAIDAAVEQIEASLPQPSLPDGSELDFSFDEFLAWAGQLPAGFDPQTMLSANELQGAMSDLSPADSAVADFDSIDWEQLSYVLSRQSALEMELQNLQVRLMTLEAMKPELEKGLSEAQDAYQQLEEGKLTLAIEMGAAKAQIEQGETELENGLEEFEKAREQALEETDLHAMITDEQLAALIQAQNLEMPAGYVRQADGGQILVKVGSEFDHVDQLENALLFSLDSIGDIRLSDIATVEARDDIDDSVARINGQPGILLTFQKQSLASTAEVTSLIHAEMENLSQQHEGLQIIPLMDQGEYIELVIDSVLQNLLIGGLLAILLLSLFLKDLRPTLVIAISIPISLMFAITLMFFSDVTLNIVSLSGLALGVGMLVDNSIVVIENTYRLRQEGLGAAQAAVKGARQMSGAILASTLTTVCVFLPIVFTQGLSRELFSDMGLTIAYSLVASLIVALSVVPTASSTLLKSRKEKSHPWFDLLVHGYGRLLGLSLRFKPIVLVLVVALFAISLYGISIMGIAFIPEMDSPQMSAQLQLSDELDLDEKNEVIDEVSEQIASIEAVEHVGALSGGMQMMGMGGGNAGESVDYYILLKENRDLSNLDVEDEIYRRTEDMDLELTVEASTMDMSALGGTGIELIVKGPQLDTLAQTAQDLATLVEQVEGVTLVEWQGESAEDELRVILDKDEAMRNGLTVGQVYQELSGLLQEDRQITTITSGTDEFPIMILNPDYEQIDSESLLDHGLTATGMDGKEHEVSLADIATIEEGFSPLSIQRSNQARYITVSAQVGSDHNVGHVSDRIEAQLEGYELPEGYTLEMAGETEMILDALEDLFLVLLLAILFIYLIMVAQFQNLLAPFIILFTIPLAFTGGILLIWVAGFDLSVIAMLGFLVLTGIVVNNGIVFISTVNQLRQEEGMDKKTALMTTGKIRIRPILMTALTTMLAMSTLALGFGSGADMTQPMAVVTIGGLGYATLLTLFVVPVLYDLFHRKPMKRIDIGEEDV